MRHDDVVYVGHMLDMARKAVARTVGVSRAVYDDDEDLRLALTHLVQTIGEAARRVSSATQQRHPEIPWSRIVGMRHRVVHDYLHVDYDMVWDVVVADLPDLIPGLERVITEEGGTA